MQSLMKRAVTGAVTTAFIGTAAIVGGGTAEAVPWGCTATPILGTAAFSQCGFEGWHRVHITCWAWWGTGSSGAFYERWGNPAWGQQQSFSSCDAPFSLRSWDIAF